MLWTEKYRPKTFDEVIGKEDIVEEIQGQVETGQISHMMFTGKPGIGKTTIGHIIARELYDEGVDSRLFKETNASDKRGISDIRNLKRFAAKSTLDGKFKLIFLDESDSLTKDAQNNLRRIMEDYSDSCKFILSGNEKWRFIDALKSRCTPFDFKPISKGECLSRLEYILEQEDATVEQETLEHLVSVYRGDLRQQINKLESIVRSDTTLELSDFSHVQLYKFVKEGNFMGAKKKANIEEMRKMYYYMMDKNIPNEAKADLSVVYAKYDFRVGKSPDSAIQLNAWLAEVIDVIEEHRND